MEPPPIPPSDNQETILFRPSKKRKIYRNRQRSSSPSTSNEPTLLPTATAALPVAQTLDELIASPGAAADVEGTEVPIAEVLKLRKLRRARVGGVEFRAAGTSSGRSGDDEAEGGRDGFVAGRGDEVDGEKVAEVGQVRRFASQTGMIGDVSNKHMMAYIDSELAKRSSASTVTLTSNSKHPTTNPSAFPATPRTQAEQNKKKEIEEVHRQPAALGKLQEIDLGDEARNRNVERTNQAWRRLAGGDVNEEEMSSDGKGRKIRLGRDGKPWRGRKRRGSEDVKRDKLVEEILRENRLEIYDEPIVQERVAGDDQAADDRIAEEFRREFMDAVNQRQSKKVAPAPPANRGPGGKIEEELMKGPKLGGSRQARAAMREAMLKNIKK